MMSATEELRELTALSKAYESEISACLTYLANEDRWRNELEREELKLKWQQERVDRLRARHGEDGEANLQHWRDKLADIKQRLIIVRNQAAVERLLRLQRELDELSSVNAPGPAPVMAACDHADHQATYECDGCSHRLTTDDGELEGTPCPKCQTGVLSDVTSEEVPDGQH